MYSATIEIPKGTDRRIHMSYDKSGFVDLGPIKEQVPVNEGLMPVHYGYLDNTLNKEEGDEVDVLVFSKNAYNIGDKVEVEVDGMLTREDDDHKIIAHDTSEKDFVFQALPEADQKLILEFMGYKSKIVAIESREQAIAYVKNCLGK